MGMKDYNFRRKVEKMVLRGKYPPASPPAMTGRQETLTAEAAALLTGRYYQGAPRMGVTLDPNVAMVTTAWLKRVESLLTALRDEGAEPIREGVGEVVTRLREWPDPTPAMLETPAFEAVWQCIKKWDINVPDVYAGYMGANGNHVRAILDAIPLLTHGAGPTPHRCVGCGHRWEGESPTDICGDCQRELQSLRHGAGPGSPWQPMETAPKGINAHWWVVPKTADETYTDTSGKPILAGGPPRMSFGKHGEWSSLEKAILWHPAPPLPSGGPETPR